VPKPSWIPHVGCAWVPVDMPHNALSNFVRFLYTDYLKLGRLTVDQLYRLLLAAKHFVVPRLAALCERQLKLSLSLDNVLPLLRASNRDGFEMQAVQDACKHFFLANYNLCTELQECEDMDAKLLCELMRLHKFRAVSTSAASAADRSSSAAGGGGGAPGAGGPPNSPANVGSLPGPPVGLPAALAGGLVARVDSRSSFVVAPPGVGDGMVPKETLGMDLRRLLDEAIDPDFEVEVQDEVIKTHKFVLVARSRYFASCLLTSGMAEAQAGRLVIPPGTPMTADAFRAFLRFLYTGDDILSMLAPHTAMYLVDAASFYGLSNSQLKHFCEFSVRASFNEAHILQLFEASSRLNVEGVRGMALDFIIANFQSVSRQPSLELLDKSLIIEIIKGVADKFPQSAAGSVEGRQSPEPRHGS